MNLKGRRFENNELGMEIFVYEVEGKELFIGKDIAKMLGYADISATVSKRVDEAYKNKVYVKTLENAECGIIVYSNNMTLISKQGVLQLIGRSAKLTQNQKQEWYKAFGIDSVFVSRKEIEFGSILCEALNELNIQVESQYNVDGYRIDFYIPKLNIAVEYDEEHHYNTTNQANDAMRQTYIESKIGAKFIRCDYRDSDIKNVMKVVKLCNEECPNKILDIELLKKLIMDYCSNTYVNEIEIIYDDNDFIHIKSFGADYVISKTKNLKKLINKSKELQNLSMSYLIIPQEKCSTNYLTRIIIHGLELEYDGELEYDTMVIPILKIIDNASVSYFYYKKEGYYGDGLDFEVDLDNINIKDLKK